MTETTAGGRVVRDRPARFLHRLHFYAGLMVGPFLLVAAISGAFYALAPTIERVVYADLLTVDAAAGTTTTVGAQAEAAAAQHPDLSIAQIWPAQDPGDTTRVLFDDPSSTDKTLPAVFVDPATATVVGEERSYSGLGELPVRRWLSGLHQHLHLGEPGELYAELAASWLWVLALGGLYLWWRRVAASRRRDAGSRTRLWRAAPAPAGEKGRRRRSLNLHAVLGVWLMVAILGLSATGITWSQKAGANVDAVVTALDWKAPKVDAALPPGSSGAAGTGSSGAAPDQADRVLAAARADGLTGPLVLRPPAEAGEGWRASERWVAWRTASDSIVVDGADGSVASRQPFAELPLFSKLSSWGIYLHMGIMFGLPLQLALFAAGAGIAVIIVLGYRMWWLRRPTVRGTSVPGLPDAPSWRIVAGVVVFAGTIGAFLPLLGISLIGFLLLDLVLIGRSGARRRDVEKQPEPAVLSGGTP